MKLSEIRAQLIAEHAVLKAIAREVDAEARRVIDGQGDSLDKLRVLLVRFDEALQTHNRHEETLLRDTIRTIDAWGPQREALMDESHEAEHAAIVRSLGECAAQDDPHEIARRADALVERVLDHIASEEKEILHPDLLRDDVVTIQSFGG